MLDRLNLSTRLALGFGTLLALLALALGIGTWELRDDRMLAVLDPGEVFGELDVLAGAAASSTVQASTAPSSSRTAASGVGATLGPVTHRPDSVTSLIAPPALPASP